MSSQQPARDAIALKLRAYFTDVVRDRQDRAWTRADELLNAHANELADKIVAASMAECTDLDCEQTMCGGAAMRHAASLIRPEVTT